MGAQKNYPSLLGALLLTWIFGQAQALEILHIIDAKDYSSIMGEAKGIKITDDGVIYVTSEEQGMLLKIVDGNIAATSLYPSVFEDSELGGIDVLPDGSLVVVNEGSGQVGILDTDLKPLSIFSQSGSSPGKLNDPKPVAASFNKKIYVGDVKNKRISVFNYQGLFLNSIGKNGDRGSDLLRPTHISIDAEENIYVLEGPTRISIYNFQGDLIERITAQELKEFFGETPELSAMTTDLSGNLYLGDDVGKRVMFFDWRKREELGRFGGLGQSRARYLEISQLSVNNSGQLAILDTRNKKVEVLQLEQTDFATPVGMDLLEVGAEIDAPCEALAAFVDNRTLCIRPDKQGIVLLEADGSEIKKFAEEAEQPHALHVGVQSVAILDKQKLHAYTYDGKHLFSIGRYGIAAGGFQNPSDVFIRYGKYYVTDKGNNRIQVFSSDGQFLEEINQQKNGEQLFVEVGPIAVDSEENLYIADRGSGGKIHVISKDRRKITSIGIEGKPLHSFRRFYGMDIDQQDRLYVLAASEFNDYWVMVFRNFKPYLSFGAAGKNETLAYFDEATSISVSSGTRNAIYINDSERQKHFRFDLLEFPDAAFGLNVTANRNMLNLVWSSSKSPLIEKYEIEAAYAKEGPYQLVTTSSGLGQTMSVEEAGKYTWFRIVTVSAHGLRGTPSIPKQNHFQTIAGLYAEDEFTETVRLADMLLKIEPDNADARDLLAMSLYRLEDYPRAINEFRQLATVKSYHDKAIRYQVRAHYELGQYLEARALIDELLEQEFADVESYFICARVSLHLADALGAVTCAEDGLTRHAENVELRYLLGRAYIEAGIVEDGLLAYRTIVQRNPDNYAVRLRIAQDLYILGRYEEALEHYSAVSAAQPDSGAAAVGRARSLLRLNRVEEAKSVAVKLSGKKETKSEGYYLLGKIAAQQGRHKEAVLRLTRAGNDSPEVIDAWLSLARAYVELNQPAKAVKALARGIEHNPDAFELYAFAGEIELQRERYDDANNYLNTAITLNPQSLHEQKLYARSLFATRNYRSASFHAEAASRIAPEDVDVLVLQADIANQQGKIGSAIEALKSAISIDAASPDLQYRIGRIYQDANLFDASRDHLERAAAIRPDWAQPHVALGNLYVKRRMFDAAVAEYEKAIELEPSDQNRAILNVAFAERKKSLEFKNNAPQLLLSDLSLQTVFSAAYKKYQSRPIGSVKLKNVSATEYGNLKLSFQIKEFMDFPTSVDITTIKGGESREVPINATFNNKILDVDEDTGVQVEVKLSYQRDGQKDDITLTQPMTIFGKNAMIWGDAQMIGSFVTPKDDTLRNYVRQVVNTYQPDPGPLNEKLVAAMAYFSSLTASGTNYIVDPNTPFAELRDDQVDYVQFPRETLQLKSGDCDDLSVLISAGLENLGIKTAFIEIPGHLFLMFDTGLAEHEADMISQDRSLLAVKDGNVWIPLEATMVNINFNEAWAEGARKYQAALAAGELGIIDLEQAWKHYQPVTLRKASYSIELPDRQRTETLVRQARNLLLQKSIDRLVLPYQTMVDNNPSNSAARLQIAILYARYGLYEKAELAFEVLDELTPNDSAINSNRGNLYFLQEDYSKAIDYYTRAAEFDSTDGGIWINLSMAQYKAGNLQAARISYRQAVELDISLEQEYDAYSKLLNQ
ncbi:MAG: tetratricopeptide repeat protein [Gammaproteobacteria bacterium]|nr:tetratricopeptide repeat protein [Gammaproteobacteria bacterium]